MRRLSTSLAAAALLALGATAPALAQPAPLVTANAPRKAKRGLFNGAVIPGSGSPRLYGRRGAGITMAQQKRAARKARNVAKHRRHA